MDIFRKKFNLWNVRLHVRWVAIFLVVGVLLSCALYLSPFGRASLVIDVESPALGRSQLFYGKDANYTQLNSSWQDIVPGQNKLVFALSGNYSSARWDFLQAQGTLKVNDIYGVVFGKRLALADVVLEPLYDVSQLQQINAGGVIVAAADAKDPQINIVFDFWGLLLHRIIICTVIGFSIGVLFVFCMLYRKFLLDVVARLDNFIDHICIALRDDGFKGAEIAWLMGLGSVFYAYFLSSFSFSIDDEMAAVRQDPAVWVSQGRWFVYFVERFIFTQSSIPFAPYVLLIASFSVSYALILRAHHYKPDWKSYAVYPVFCAFPTWWFISEFYSNVPAVAFGVFFVSLSLYIVSTNKIEKTYGVMEACAKYSVVVLMLACATSAYQALLLLYVTMVFGVLLFRIRHEGRRGQGVTLLREAVSFLIKNAVLVVISMVFYGVINSVTQRLIAADSGYIGKFINYQVIFTQPVDVLLAVIGEMQSIYSGDVVRYGASIGLASLIIFGATLSLFSRRPGVSTVRLLLWIGVLTVPFTLHFLSGGAPLPMRAMLAIAYVSWLACLVMLSNKLRSAVVLATLIVGVYQLQVYSVTSQYIASATITQAHDRMVAADIYKRIGELDKNFDRNAPLEIDVFGNKSIKTLYASAWWATMQGSFFSWDDGNIDRMLNYMKVMGYENLHAPTTDDRIAMTPVFRDMPVWPASGSVKKVGGRYLVRLSKEPDPIHARFIP